MITMCNSNNHDDNNTNTINDSDTLQFICKLRNFMHTTSMQKNGAAIALPGSGRILWRISGHLRFRSV